MRRVPTLVVEDEPLARESLCRQLAAAPWLEIVAEARDGREALDCAQRLRPELCFLDVRLPELSGLEVARRLGPGIEIVFTTAFDRFAIAAFEIGAIDYLVKPFGGARLAATLERVQARLGQAVEPASARAAAALGAGPLNRLYARQGDRIVPVAAATISRIEAQGDYAEVHAAAGTFLLHVSLGELVARLDPGRFRRVHRSHIVNMDEVAHLVPGDDRRLRLKLRNGEEIVASRSASEELRKLVR